MNITKEEFLEKIKLLMVEEPDDFEIEDGCENKTYYPHNLPNEIKQDFDSFNVDFNWENFTTFDGGGFGHYPVGYKNLNDVHTFFAQAGGDWEFPICFIYYWDGKNIRVYVPSKGNVWNKETKQAYGNESNEIIQISWEELDEQISEKEMIDEFIGNNPRN